MRVLSVVFGILFCLKAFCFDPIVIVVGPPGSGKGYFSQFLSDRYSYAHISAGDLLREEVEKKTECGIKIEPILKRGDPVSAEIMQDVLKRKILEVSKNNRRFTIDGFGGQHPQDVSFLKQCLTDMGLFPQVFVVFIESRDENCMRRMIERRICPNCSRIYNLSSDKPKDGDKCDECGVQLVTRPQDTDSVIAHRIKRYRDCMERNYSQFADHFPSLTVNVDAMGDVTCFYDKIVSEVSTLESQDFFRLYCRMPISADKR